MSYLVWTGVDAVLLEISALRYWLGDTDLEDWKQSAE